MLGTDPYKVEDTRTPLDKIGRTMLRKVLRANNVQFEYNSPATLLRQIINASGIDWMNFNPSAYDAKVKADKEAERQAALEELKPPKIEDMGRPDLMRLCKERGIKFVITDKVEDLIGKLNGQNATTNG